MKARRKEEMLLVVESKESPPRVRRSPFPRPSPSTDPQMQTVLLSRHAPISRNLHSLNASLRRYSSRPTFTSPTHRSFDLPSGSSVSIGTGLFINNDWVPAQGGQTFEYVSPRTSAVRSLTARLAHPFSDLPVSSSYAQIYFAIATPLRHQYNLICPAFRSRHCCLLRSQGVQLDLGSARSGIRPREAAQQASGSCRTRCSGFGGDRGDG
jgi:hypothetical protein